jgi:hypothetical protein
MSEFEDGIIYALEYLEGIYGEGITHTDIWNEYTCTKCLNLSPDLVDETCWRCRNK